MRWGEGNGRSYLLFLVVLVLDEEEKWEKKYTKEIRTRKGRKKVGRGHSPSTFLPCNCCVAVSTSKRERLLRRNNCRAIHTFQRTVHVGWQLAAWSCGVDCTWVYAAVLMNMIKMMILGLGDGSHHSLMGLLLMSYGRLIWTLRRSWMENPNSPMHDLAGPAQSESIYSMPTITYNTCLELHPKASYMKSSKFN